MHFAIEDRLCILIGRNAERCKHCTAQAEKGLDYDVAIVPVEPFSERTKHACVNDVKLAGALDTVDRKGGFVGPLQSTKAKRLSLQLCFTERFAGREGQSLTEGS